MTAIERLAKTGLALALIAGLAACATSSREFPVPEVIPTQVCGGDADSDGDGVNECNDRCPGTIRGEAVDEDGCPLPPPPEPQIFRG